LVLSPHHFDVPGWPPRRSREIHADPV
jgi:hypothetical protein